MEFLVGDTGEIQGAITIHSGDNNPVAFTPERNTPISLDVQCDGELRAINDPGQQKRSPYLDVSISVTSEQQIVVLNVTGEFNLDLFLPALHGFLTLSDLFDAVKGDVISLLKIIVKSFLAVLALPALAVLHLVEPVG